MPKPTQKYSKISVVVPVFNEETTILELIRRVLSVKLDGFFKEIIIVDDCSTDSTPHLIDGLVSAADTYSVKKIALVRNVGKSQALKAGILISTGDIVIVQDGDLEYDPSDYERLLLPFLEQKADVVYGSRFLGGEAKRILYFWHTVGNKALTALSNMCTNLNLTDMETGCKVFEGGLIRKIAPTISSGRFGFEPEITAKIAKISELNIYEVGISYRGRTYKEGKKIKWTDGLFAIVYILKYNFFHFNS